MRIRLVAVGEKMPAWVATGYAEYAKRMPRECRLELLEIPAKQRGTKVDVKRVLQEEGQKILRALAKNSFVIALDRPGKQLTTEALAHEMQQWLGGGQNVDLLVGGPEGLAPEVLSAAKWRWSLSTLTMAHPVVRVVVAEQIYRASSLLRGLPYHRG